MEAETNQEMEKKKEEVVEEDKTSIERCSTMDLIVIKLAYAFTTTRWTTTMRLMRVGGRGDC